MLKEVIKTIQNLIVCLFYHSIFYKIEDRLTRNQ